MPSRRALPPLHRLAAFEAAARLLNFSLAAQSLGMTQSAVSQQVLSLEEALGRPLFQRLHRGVRLTEAGATLLEAVTRSLDGIADVIAVLRQEVARSTLTIATDFGFASFWLMPRLHALADALPGVEVRIVTSQLAPNAPAEDADITILFGDGAGRGVVMLFGESVRPVCSPAFLAQHGGEISRDWRLLDWSRLPLLHLDAPDPVRWLRWADWFAGHGLPPRNRRDRSLRFNTYPLVVEAALLGEGVALGWEPLVDRLLNSGALVPVVADAVVTGRGYCLAEAPRGRGNPATLAFRAWLLAECAAGIKASAPSALPQKG
jgi:LysR family transcriptional regulator, glycine cleavage system transcriptional activator